MSAFGPAAAPGFCPDCRCDGGDSTVQEWFRSIDRHERMGDRSIELRYITEGLTAHVNAYRLGPLDRVSYCLCGVFRTLGASRV